MENIIEQNNVNDYSVDDILIIENVVLPPILIEDDERERQEEQQPDINTSPETPKSTKRRKRSGAIVPRKTPIRKLPEFTEEDDDGSTCPICLDVWEISGVHRLTSLKCGHLFGHSCIKRWLLPTSNRFCPSCKMKAKASDLRFIYAKKITAVDNTEEIRLLDELEKERAKCSKIQMESAVTKWNLELQIKITNELESKLNKLSKNGIFIENKQFGLYKLFMEKNIEISKEPGCRVMLYSCKHNTIIVSLKSTQSIFPSGYGLRFIDTPTFRPKKYLPISTKPIRDLNFNDTDDLLITTSMEYGAKLYNVHSSSLINIFTPSECPLWSCNMDKQHTNYLYLGSQNGSTFLYDIRNNTQYLDEYRTEGDLSPVINICSITTQNDFPFGGFLVCKLKSLWFFEFTSTQQVNSNLLNIDGPFLSMNVDKKSGNILISTRPSSKYPTTRFIIANLCKVNNESCVLSILQTFLGSKTLTVMTRATQINTEHDTIIAGYLEDQQLLTTWSCNSKIKMQSLHVNEIIYDMCQIEFNDNTYLGAITEKKCRLYKLNPETIS